MINQSMILQFAEVKRAMSKSKFCFMDSHHDKICSLAWCKDVLVSGSRDTTSKLWSTSGEVKHTLGDHTSSVTGVFVIKNKIYTLSYDCKLRRWDCKSGKLEHCQYLFSPITYVIELIYNTEVGSKQQTKQFFSSLNSWLQ